IVRGGSPVSAAWKMSATYPDASHGLLCEANSEAWVRSWCRKLLRSGRLAHALSITLYRWRDLPHPEWHTERVYLPPFVELLSSSGGGNSSSLAAPTTDQGRSRPTATRGLAPVGTPFTEPVLAEVAPADPNLTARYVRLLAWLSAAGAGPWSTFRDVCR